MSTLTSKDGVQKADAYCWMAQWKGDTLGWVSAPGNWITYEDYMALWDAYQELRRLPSETCDALDAAKWRALRNCARITAMGSAGMRPEKATDDYAHVTLNFWTGGTYDSPGEPWAREWLDTFVEKALRAQPPAKKAGEQRPHQGLLSGAGLQCDSTTCWCHAWERDHE
jgi:hypothetical protein